MTSLCKHTVYVPCAGQAVWNACQKLRRTALRLAALLHKIITHSCQHRDAIKATLARLMGLEHEPMDVAVLLRGTRRTDTLEQAARALDTRVDIRAGLQCVRREMGQLALAEGLAADKDFAIDMSRIARLIMLKRLRRTASTYPLPAPSIQRMALSLIRPT